MFKFGSVDFLGGGFNYFLCSTRLGEMIQFDGYFSKGLKPPTSFQNHQDPANPPPKTSTNPTSSPKKNSMESSISLTLESLHSKQVFQVPPPMMDLPGWVFLAKAVWSSVPWSEDFVEIRGGDAPTSAKPTKWEVRMNQRTNGVSRGGNYWGAQRAVTWIWLDVFFFSIWIWEDDIFHAFPFSLDGKSFVFLVYVHVRDAMQGIEFGSEWTKGTVSRSHC